MQADFNESQPVCHRCGGDCDCEPPIDWEELERDTRGLLEAVIPICEEAEARRTQTLLSVPPATDTVQ